MMDKVNLFGPECLSDLGIVTGEIHSFIRTKISEDIEFRNSEERLHSLTKKASFVEREAEDLSKTALKVGMHDTHMHLEKSLRRLRKGLSEANSKITEAKISLGFTATGGSSSFLRSLI